ncbi:MAG: hypothetical protein RL120_14550, partial [Gammaproteobacteria bacterium]
MTSIRAAVTDPEQGVPVASLIEELKRRKVFRVAAVYAVVSWLLIQVADTVMPALQMPDWTVSFVTILLILGFPVAIILSWAYDATPSGIRPDAGAAAPAPVAAAPGQGLNYAILLLVLAFGVLQLSDRFMDPDEQSADSTNTVATIPARGVLRSALVLSQPLEPSTGTGLRTLLDITADGSRLVYTRYNQGIGNQDILTLKDLSSGEERELVQTGMFAPNFSPDGSRIA